MEQAEALKAKGVQVLACLTVNDVFVTEEWGQAHQAKGKVRYEVLSEGSDPGRRIPCLPLHLIYSFYVLDGYSCHGIQMEVGG